MKTPEEKYQNDPYYRQMVDQLEHYLVMAQTTPSELREMVTFACIQYEMRRPLSGLVMKSAVTSALRRLDSEHPIDFIVPPPKHHGDKPATEAEHAE